MFERLILSLYAGTLFSIVFLVAPVLLQTKKDKNLAGRFYGRILWRFYKLAFFMILFYFLLADEKVYTLLLMVGLALNVGLSFYLKNLKRELGDIDQIDYDHPKRIEFRRLSLLSTALFFINFLLSIFVLIKTFGGANGV
jgi:Ca2+/Na+ antiporter